MKITPEEAKQKQLELSKKVKLCKLEKVPQILWGIDVSFPASNVGLGVIVALKLKDGKSKFCDLSILEVAYAFKEVDFPYIPGLLSFRESGVILEAFKNLKNYKQADLIFVDGNGLLHPRKFGIASHLGIIFDVPTIGVAKNLLCGHLEKEPREKGEAVPVMQEDTKTLSKEVIGYCLKTQKKTKPIYVSAGHRITNEEAVYWTYTLCKYKLPEPIRLADFYTKKLKTLENTLD